MTYMGNPAVSRFSCRRGWHHEKEQNVHAEVSGPALGTPGTSISFDGEPPAGDMPIQTAHRSADLQGIGRTHLVERRWEPELRATGLLYLMENENALLMTDTHLGLLGWETERGSAVDCTGDAPLYVGQYDAVYDDRMVNCYFGRIDDPTIELVELQIRAEPFDQATPEFYCLSVEREAFIKQGDHTFFLDYGGPAAEKKSGTGVRISDYSCL